MGAAIKTTLHFIDCEQYVDAKISILPQAPTLMNSVIDLYGNEADFAVKLLHPFLATKLLLHAT